MGFYRGPKLITEGLQICFDAGNVKSYPASGTTMKDLSGNGNNGTISGAVSYSDSSLNFAGGRVTINNSPSINVVDFTVLMFIKTPAVYGGTYKAFFSKQGVDRDYNFYAYSPDNGSIERFHFSTARITGAAYQSTANITGGLTLDKWHQVGVSLSSTNLRYILNGQVIQDTYISGYSGATSNYPLWIGQADNVWVGGVSNFLFYDRALSGEEIEINYNIFKDRYGL